MKDLILLGATGNIGCQALELLKFSNVFNLVGVSLNNNTKKLEEYLLYFPSLKYVAICDEKKAKDFKLKHPAYEIICGSDLVSNSLIDYCPKATVFNAIADHFGMPASYYAILNNRDLILSNKETTYLYTKRFKAALENYTGVLYPVDSEHVAIAKLLAKLETMGVNKDDITEVLITASGGALRDIPVGKFDKMKIKDVLKHPTWKMSKSITIDCATLVNKAYEVIEASTLFNIPIKKIKAKICRTSLIHAQIKYKQDDKIHSIVEYSPNDMMVSINYGLQEGKTLLHENNSDDLKAIKETDLVTIDNDRYPLFNKVLDMYKKYSDEGMFAFYNANYSFKDYLRRDEVTFKIYQDALLKFIDEIQKHIQTGKEAYNHFAETYLDLGF